MYGLRKALVIETIKFIELCQKIYYEGKIGFDRYIDYTEIKFDFLNNLVFPVRYRILLGREFRFRLKNIYLNNSIIRNNKNLPQASGDEI